MSAHLKSSGQKSDIGAAVVCLLLSLLSCGYNSRDVAAQIPRYENILQAQRREPRNEALVQHGQQVFLNGPCAMCHSIRGTIARSRVGPDLTHLASRKTLAAGTLPNTRGHLAGWILNPQNLKPGTVMPPSLLPAEDLHALVAFLETLH